MTAKIRGWENYKMIQHVVLMKFNPEVTSQQIDELEKRLDDLPNTIIEIQGYEFGRDIVRSERSYDFALVSLFANMDTLRRYQNHPRYLEVVDILKGLCGDILAVDFELQPPGRIEEDLTQLFKGI
jgi:Stress responsive A/B Barrel Domain